MVDAPNTAPNTALRAQLEEEQARLREQLKELHASDDSFDDGFADTSQVTAERGEIEALRGSLAEALRDHEDALAKFDAGTYGRCEECGDEIGEARLEAMPAARFCILHASTKR